MIENAVETDFNPEDSAGTFDNWDPNVSITAHVPENIRKKILEDKFVDFGTLLDASSVQNDSVLSLVNGRICIKPQAQKKIEDIDVWSDAFAIYVAIYTSRFPNASASLMQYFANIKHLHRVKGNWISYDQSFRRHRAISGSPWDKLNSDLWMKNLSPPVSNLNLSKHRTNQPFPKKRGSIPLGFCFAYNKGLHHPVPFESCRYKHQCSKCSGLHPASECRRGSTVRQNQSARTTPTTAPTKVPPNTGK